ncbi:hypothetical protein ACFU80_19655, partial [Streptomyces erythrochromogenes]
MADADSVLGSISLDEIIALGNAWIRLGDEIHERRVAVNGHLNGLGMTGNAGDLAHRAWDEALGRTIDDAAETAWTIGQTIHRYAEELHKAADEYAKKVNASMWATILGAIVGLAFLALGPLLGNLLSTIGSLLGRLIPVLSQMAARLGTLGTTAVGAAGGAVSGAALSLGIDVAVGAAGAAIAGTDYEVDWGAEAWSMGLGGLTGGVLGGFAGYHYTPRPAGPVAGPGTGAPAPAPRGGPAPGPGGNPTAAGGGAHVTPAPRMPSGDPTAPHPGALGRGEGAFGPGALAPRGGSASAHEAHPTNSGAGAGRTGDVGLPHPGARSEGSATGASPAGTPAPHPAGTGTGGAAVSPEFRPGQRLGGSPANPHGTPPARPGSGHQLPAAGRPETPAADPSHGTGQRLGSAPANPHGTPLPKPAVGQQRTETPTGTDPFGGAGQRLGGPPANPHGTPAPLPAKGSASGDSGPAVTSAAGRGHDYPATAANRPAGETGDGPRSGAPTPPQPFERPGRPLGGPQADPHGTAQPRPGGGNRAGEAVPGTGGPVLPTRSGPGFERPATLDDIRGGPSGGGRGPGQGGGNLRSNDGSSTYVETPAPGARPGPGAGTRSGGDDVRPPGTQGPAGAPAPKAARGTPDPGPAGPTSSGPARTESTPGSAGARPTPTPTPAPSPSAAARPGASEPVVSGGGTLPRAGSPGMDGHPTAPGTRPAGPGTAPSGSPGAPTPGGTASKPVEPPSPVQHEASAAGTPGVGAPPVEEPSRAGAVPPARETPGPRGTPVGGAAPVPGAPSRHPGDARFDLGAARARLDDPSVQHERRDAAHQWAAEAVLDRIGRVAPGENPLGVVPRPQEVVDLVAAEHLRGGPLPATTLLNSLVPGAQPFVAPPSAGDAPLPAPSRLHLAPPSGRTDLDPVRDWENLSAVPKTRSKQVRDIDEAVRQLRRNPGVAALNRVLDAVQTWQGGKQPTSSRWGAVAQLKGAIQDQLYASRQSAGHGESSAQGAAGATAAPETAAPSAGPSAPTAGERAVEVEGFAPASGFEAELHGYQVVVPRKMAAADLMSLGNVVEMPGLLAITLDFVGGKPVLEVVADPARGLVRGPDDGRAERSDVVAAFRNVLERLATAKSGASLSQIFPAPAGFHVDVEALDLRVLDAGGSTMLVHHTATAPLSGVIEFLEHVRDRMRTESEPVRIAKQDLEGALVFARDAGVRFGQWLAGRPEQASAWDRGDLEGALALGYTQVAAAARDLKSVKARSKDFTAVASREPLQAIRAALGVVPGLFLEEHAEALAGDFERSVRTAMATSKTLLDRPMHWEASATIGQYLDNLLREFPERVIDQYQALRIRTSFGELDSNPDVGTGTRRIDPPVVRMESRPYASAHSTRDTVLQEYGTLADLSLDLYNRARQQRGLRPVGGPVVPPVPAAVGGSSGQVLAAPPTATAVLDEPPARTRPAGPAPVSARPALLAGIAARLPGMAAEERTRELALLAPDALDALAADEALVARLRDVLPPPEFADAAAHLLLRVPEGVEQPVSARNEARDLIAGMLADPEVAARLLTGGTRIIVVPRNVPVTSLGPFAVLHGTRVEARSLDTVRGIHHDGRVAVTEENLLGETTSVPGDGVYPDGYSTTTHEIAHAIHERGLSAADRALVASAYRSKMAEGTSAHWPDGPLRDPSGVRPGSNYSSRDEHEYFAQLSNAYLGTNAGTDAYTGERRNNGAAWVRRHERTLLPLLERLYGPRQEPGGRAANPFTAVQAESETWAGFRGLWDRAEQELRPQPHVPAPAALQTQRPSDGSGSGSSGTAIPGSPGGSPGDTRPVMPAPPTTTTVLEEPATGPATGLPPAQETPAVSGRPQAEVAAQLAAQGLSPVFVLAGGDALAHALIAVAPKESGQLAGRSRPATPQELRDQLADAVAADLRRTPAERRLLSAETLPNGPDGAPLLPGAAEADGADEIARAVRTGGGPASSDWLTLAVAASGLGLRITVLAADGVPWTVGPHDGRPVVLLWQEQPGPHAARWVATEPVAAAEQARRPGRGAPVDTSGFTWGSAPAAATPPPGTVRNGLGALRATAPERPAATSGPADPVVYFGESLRPAGSAPAPSATETTTAAASVPARGSDPVPAAHDPGEGGSGSGSGSGHVPAPHEDENAEPPALSPYVNDYGARHDGRIGLAPHDPIPEDVLDALHHQVLNALGVAPGSAAGPAVLRQLSEALSSAEIGLHLPYVRSTRGHRITVTVDGTEHTVDVRLRLTHPRPVARGTGAGVPRDTKLERQSEGSQTSSAAESSGTVRTIPLPWTAIYNGPAGPLRWFDGALTLTLTHHQLTQSATVSEGVTTTSMQRANDPAHAVEFTGRWQVRVDAGRSAPVPAWGPEHDHGRLTVWFPEYRATGHGGALGPFPQAAGLDDFPLWGVEAVAEPGRLLDELFADDAFAVLRSLGEGSRSELEDFLSEGMLRNTLPMQRDRGVYSPLLLDGGGNVLGVLRLAATVRPGSPDAQTPHGRFRLESWFTHTSGVDRSARLTSGIGLDGRGGPVFTPDHAPGHPAAARRVQGIAFGKAGVSWQPSDALNVSNKASMMHALYTDTGHLHVPSDISYRITLVRAGGGTATGSFGPWPEGVQLRMLPRGIVRAPAQEELRGLPGHLEHLESIGFSAVPLGVSGADRMFERAQEWLRREGFLPPQEHSPYGVNGALAPAQLANLRRLEQLRSRMGLAAALPDAVEGGRPVWFEQPGTVSGSRRVQLRFTASRDRTPRPGETGAPASVHTGRVPDVQTAGNTSHEARGTRQRGNQFGGTLGGGGGVRWPLADGAWGLDSTAEYTGGAQSSASATAGSSQGGDQYTITSKGGTDIFTVPARFSLDLYEGSAQDPRVRFADPASDPASVPLAGPGPAVTGPLGRPVVPAAPTTVAGHVTLAVPHQRTVPVQGRILPAPALDVIRAPRTGGGPADDGVRLRLTDPAGQPQPGLLRLPDDAIVDVFRASAALREAFRQLATGTYPGRPDAGPLGRGLHTFTGRLPDLVTAPGIWLGAYLAGPAAGDQSAFAGEVLNQHLRVSNLLARAQQIFSSTYVIEGLVLPGLGADQELSLEITGYLSNPAHSGSFRSHGQRDVNATDTAARQRTGAVSHQVDAAVTALRAAPAAPAGSTPRGVPQANPSVRVSRGSRTETTVEHSASTSVVRLPTDAADQYLITADATVLVTLRQGTRNVLGNLAGLGSRDGITVAVDLPGAVQFTMARSHFGRYAPWFAGVLGLPRLVREPATLPPPDHFVRTGEIGTGSVLSVTQVDHPARRTEVRGRLHEELLVQVERVAPGVTRPGHAAYLPGVATRLADLTAPPALRALPGRGTVKLWFRYAATGGGRLVEVTLAARPAGEVPARRELRGRPAGGMNAVETVHIHAPENRSDSRAVTRTWQAQAAPVSRYPRPGDGQGHTDRTGPVLSASTTRTSGSRSDHSADDRLWTRSGNAADFDDIVYDITATVRSELIWDWPPDLIGGALNHGWVSLTERDGGTLSRRLARMMTGARGRQVSVPALVSIRFIGSEAVDSPAYDPPVRPRTTLTDPRLPHAPGSDDGRSFTAGPVLVPTGPTPVTGFNGFPELAGALRTVAPDSSGAWGLSADATPEAAAARLGELLQAGRITVGLAGTAAGLTTTMPGAWPGESDPEEAPTLHVTLHNPRPITAADDVAVDRVRKPVVSTSSSAVAGAAVGLGYQSTLSGSRANLHVVGFTAPLLAQQPVTRTRGAAASAGQRDRIKTGNPVRSATGANTHSHEVLADAVITVTGPAGTRYVTGSVGVRLFERELLGHGAIGPRVAPGVYDLPSMLAGQPSAALRNWATHPATELPAVLAGGLDGRGSGAQLWLDLGPDPDGSRLARALYVGSRTARSAGRPVELVVRGGTGLRFWPFTAEGGLADLTPATTPAWNLLRTAVVTAADAADAEADAAVREAGLGPREAEAARQLDAAAAELATAVIAHEARAAELAAARTDRQSLADRHRDAALGRAEAQEEADRRERAVTTAGEALATAEQALRRLQVEAARKEPTGSGAAGPAAPGAAAGPDAVSAARDVRDAARSEWDAARGAADLARQTARRAADAVAELEEQLAAAGKRVGAAATGEAAAAAEVTRATAVRDTRYDGHGRLRRELERARQEQADQRALWNDAWTGMPGPAGMLAADRCREGTGGARFPLDSLGRAPGG